MTITITFQPDLKARVIDPKPKLIPLRDATEVGQIYGTLVVEIHGRPLPAMGYFGDDGVNFQDWIVALSRVLIALNGKESSFTYDPGSQNQPAYQFERQGESVLLSIVETETGGEAIADWQKVSFSLADLEQQYLGFKTAFLQTLSEQQPAAVDEWSHLFGWPDQKDSADDSWAFLGGDMDSDAGMWK